MNKKAYLKLKLQVIRSIGLSLLK